MLLGSQADEGRPQQRAGGEIERLGRLLTTSRRASPGDGDRSTSSTGNDSGGGITICTGSPSVAAKTVRTASWRRTTSVTARPRAAASSRPVRRRPVKML